MNRMPANCAMRLPSAGVCRYRNCNYPVCESRARPRIFPFEESPACGRISALARMEQELTQ